MIKFNKDSIQSAKGIALGLILVLGISTVSAQSGSSYSAPTSMPTGGNAAAPLNIGASAQAKQGSLSVFAFTALQNSYFAQKVGVGDQAPDANLKLDVEGEVGATKYCDQNGLNCKAITDIPGDGFFPKPAADSRWRYMDKDSNYTFCHNLNTLNYIVYIEAEDTSSARGVNIANMGTDDNATNQKGFTWKSKTANCVTIRRGDEDQNAHKIRVLIWKYPALY